MRKAFDPDYGHGPKTAEKATKEHNDDLKLMKEKIRCLQSLLESGTQDELRIEQRLAFDLYNRPEAWRDTQL